MKIRFGVGLGAGPEASPEELPHLVDRLEAAGIDSLWFSELVYTDAVDPFVGMAYALARTTELKVGTSVMILPGRHPVLVAKQLASLAALAPKRVLPVFGLRSAIPAERDVFVVPDGQRAAVFDEALTLLKAALDVRGLRLLRRLLHGDVDGRRSTPRQAARHLAGWLRTRGVPPHRSPGRRLVGQFPHPRRGSART